MGNFTQLFTRSSLKSLALTSITALAMAAPSAQARTITADEALQRALDMNQTEVKTLGFKANPHLVYTMAIGSTQTPGLYVFAGADNRGFMIVSADDEARALLGYSESGTFDPQNIPAPIEYWLSCYTDEIATLPQGENPIRNLIATNENESSVGPLLSTQWTQTTPFNNQCPQFNGRNTVTGCTATAMAQIMKYFNYPEHGTGSYGYEWNGEYVSSDFEAHTYDWDNMLASYTGDYDTAQEEAIAQLMRDCAISIKTNFGPENSQATALNALKAFGINFGYDPRAHYMDRKYYSPTEWEEAIYQDLDNNRPVFYSGRTADDKKGHAFVCDGYAGGYFHINWGWAGMSDGYYTLTALEPTQQGVGGATSGYNSKQCIITNIYPNEGGDYWVELVSDHPFHITESSVQVGESINFSVGLHNLSAIDVIPVVGLAFTNTEDNQTVYSAGAEYGYFIGPNQYYPNAINFRRNIPSDLGDGKYIVRPAYKELSGEWHILHVDMSQTRSYNMTVSGKTATFSPIEAPIPEVTSSELLTTLYSKCAFKATVTLRNPTDKEFSGMVYPYFITAEGTYKVDGVMVALEAGEEKQFEYISVLNVPVGQYQMCYCIASPSNPEAGHPISDKVAVTVREAQLVIPEISDVRFVDGTNDINASELAITFDVNVNEGIYQNPIYLGLYPSTGGDSLHFFPSEPMFFDGGFTPDVTVTYDISAWVEIGNSYLVVLYAYHNGSISTMSAPYEITIGSLNGISTIVADRDIISTTYYTLHGLQLKDKPADAGVYIKVDRLSNGSTSTTKVIVR